jgi:hypothetical protein
MHEAGAHLPAGSVKPRSGEPILEGVTIHSVGSIRLLCMTHYEGLYLYIRTRIGPGRRQEKSRAALEGGGYRQARLNDKIVTRCNALTNLCICCK